MEMRHNRNFILFLLLVSLFQFVWTLESSRIGDAVDDSSLRPLPLERVERVERAGLPNFFRVSKDLYRGGKPEKKGVLELQKLGIRTVVSLLNSKAEESLFRGSGIDYVSIPMSAFFPKRERFRRFLEIVSDPTRFPVFVHCRYGSDRTGVAVALYRIKVQKWTPEEAIHEMVDGGYGFHLIHSDLIRFVRRY